MQGHIADLATGSGVTVIGETLEAALELGEKHEAFVSKCKEVSVCVAEEGGEEGEGEEGGGEGGTERGREFQTLSYMYIVHGAGLTAK